MKAIYKGFKISLYKTTDVNLYSAFMIAGMEGNPNLPPSNLFAKMSCCGRGEYSGYVYANDPCLKIVNTDGVEEKKG